MTVPQRIDLIGIIIGNVGSLGGVSIGLLDRPRATNLKMKCFPQSTCNVNCEVRAMFDVITSMWVHENAGAFSTYMGWVRDEVWAMEK